jgi:hypothetical protein
VATQDLLQSDLIVSLIVFSGQACVLSRLRTTLIFKINLLNAPASNIKDEGTPLAQASVAGAMTSTRTHSFDHSDPGTKSPSRIKEFIESVNEKVWDRCGNCHGKGKIPGRLRPTRRCQPCNGTGYVQNSAVLILSSPTKLGAKKTRPHINKPRTRTGD